jgi:transposase InsO family protein
MMTVSPEQFEQLNYLYRLSPDATAYVSAVRASPPARQVTSVHVRNTLWRYASHKMHRSISAESSLEKTFLALCEYDDDVIEYWDQPGTVRLTYRNAKRHWRRSSYTPDVLVLRKAYVEVIQIKPSSVCESLVEERPGRWRKSDGRFHDTAADCYFKTLGLKHTVITERDIDPLMAENTALLLRARHCNCLAYTDELKGRALKALIAEQSVTMAELMRHLRIDDTTPVLKMIDDGIVCVDLQSDRLSDLYRAFLAMSHRELRMAREARDIVLSHLQREGVSTAQAPHPREAASMVDRLHQLHGEIPSVVSGRSLRRWRAELAKAGGNPLSLAPAIRRRGRRGSRIDPADSSAAIESIKRHYLSDASMSMTAAHRLYVLDIRKANKLARGGPRLHWVSLPTFIKLIEAMNPEHVASCRGGQRSAHAAAMPVDAPVRSLKATRPFERVHIDHYKLDQHLVLVRSRRRTYTRRAWLTVARDEYSGAVLAMSLSFDAPSRVACATVLRDCVRRHGRLPEIVMVDNGKEFESVYFEALLARYGVTKQNRPAGAPRFGSTIESLFRTLKEHYLRAMPGNTTNDDRGRSVSPSHRGQAHAQWTLRDAYVGCEYFFWRCFNATPARGRDASPEVLLATGLHHFSCSGVPVTFDDAFIVASAIPLPRPLTVDHQRGIRHLDQWYVHPELFTLKPGTTVDVMYEPWDARCLYALIRDRWVPCFHGPMPYAQACFDRETMFESIASNGRGTLRTELEQHREVEIALAVEEGKKRANKRKSKPLLNPETSPAYGSAHPLPKQHVSRKRFSHFDDQES